MKTFTTRGMLLILVTAILSAAGIVLMKAGLVRNAWVTLLLPGVVVYGVGVIFGLILIGRYPISLVYPALAGLSLSALAGISTLALGEPLTVMKVAGTALIIVGVMLLLPRSPAPAQAQALRV